MRNANTWLFQPLVSIIIPVYNGANYLREAMDSALNQTYTHYEVIVVNDGSTDSTEAIIKSYGTRVRLFSKANGGVSTALNLGIEKSRGEYISWLSHDDVYARKKLAIQMKVARNDTICFSNYKIIDDQSRVIETPAIEKVSDTRKFACHLYPVVKGLVFGCTLLIPKKCFVEQGLFDETLWTSQDYDMWLRLFPQYKLAFQPDYLLLSRRHLGQGTYSPRALTESNAFWIRVMRELSDRDKITIDGNLWNFYHQMYLLMHRVGYGEAAAHALKQKLRCREPFLSKIHRVFSKLS